MDEKEIKPEAAEKDELILETVDANTVPCLHCKWGFHNFLAMYCVKYNKKPDDVYYHNAECPNFEKLK